MFMKTLKKELLHKERSKYIDLDKGKNLPTCHKVSYGYGTKVILE